MTDSPKREICNVMFDSCVLVNGSKTDSCGKERFFFSFW